MELAFVCPGQGSQSAGMQKALADAFPAVRATYAEAGEVLGYDLWRLVQDGPVERLNETVVTQPAMLAAGVAAWRAWQDAGGTDPQQFAGHSLGEYTALVCGGALEFAAAVKVVQRRSQLMQQAVPPGSGAMAAIIGLDDEAVVGVCERAASGEVAQPANFNAPGQVVVAGHSGAIDRVIEMAREAGARRGLKLAVSVPAHSSLMQAAAEALAEELAGTEFRRPPITVVNSVTAEPYGDPPDIRQRLEIQVFNPVRWVQTVQSMLDTGATAIVECGPGKVLTGLNKRISRATPTGFIDSPESLELALELQ